MTKKKSVRTSIEAGLATVTFHHPPHNLLSIEMMEQINDELLSLRSRSDLKVVVLRGAGDVFTLGLDYHDHTKAKVTRLIQVFHRIFETIRLLDLVTVAAVHGDAKGGGFELAIGCNLIVAADSAKFGLPEISHGVFPPLACVVLPRAGPRRKAMEWILTGDEISSSELERRGLVNRVFAAGSFENDLREFLAKLTTKSAPVLRLARQAQVSSYYATYEEALYKTENAYLRELLALKDSHEGVAALLENRDPEWTDS